MPEASGDESAYAISSRSEIREQLIGERRQTGHHVDGSVSFGQMPASRASASGCIHSCQMGDHINGTSRVISIRRDPFSFPAQDEFMSFLICTLERVTVSELICSLEAMCSSCIIDSQVVLSAMFVDRDESTNRL